MFQQIPSGVKLLSLITHSDERGQLTEIYKDEWMERGQPIQWNLTHANPNTLRGMHLHPNHSDYLVVINGTMFLGLFDFRKNSPTVGQSCILELKGEKKCAGIIPPGVAHGFCFLEPTTYLYGLDTYWSSDKDFVVKWNDPQLKLDWPIINPIISDRDKKGLTYNDFINLIDSYSFEIYEK